MAMSKHDLVGAFEKQTLTLEEKIKLLDYAEANQKLGGRNIAEVFNIGKTAAANILKNKKEICEQYKNAHDKNKKTVALGNTSLSVTFCMIGTKNVAPLVCIQTGPLLRDEVMEIKEQLKDS